MTGSEERRVGEKKINREIDWEGQGRSVTGQNVPTVHYALNDNIAGEMSA